MFQEKSMVYGIHRLLYNIIRSDVLKLVLTFRIKVKSIYKEKSSEKGERKKKLLWTGCMQRSSPSIDSTFHCKGPGFMAIGTA